jgi:pseudouridine-5'-phosphate glycosidase/pseudouridine kinase
MLLGQWISPLACLRFCSSFTDSHRSLGLSTGALFGVPIPEEYESVGQDLQASVEQAVRESEENGMSKRGKEVTPWLLKRVGELTQGSSLKSSKQRLRSIQHHLTLF